MSQVAFLFPGQGAQHVGMGVKIAEAYPAAKALFDQASEILGYNLLGLCANGPEEKLNATNISQPALYVSSLASLELVKDRQPELLEQCQIAAGLSLGEYTALAFAGALSFEDGLRVVKARGEAMQAAAEATPSGMVSILLLDEKKSPACANRSVMPVCCRSPTTSARAISSSPATKQPARKWFRWPRKTAAGRFR